MLKGLPYSFLPLSRWYNCPCSPFPAVRIIYLTPEELACASIKATVLYNTTFRALVVSSCMTEY